MKDLREWLQFVIVAGGGVIGLLAYLQNLRQRRVENALRFIQLFRDGLRPGDLDVWTDLMRRSSESAGAKRGEYAHNDGTNHSIGDYFSEGAGDDYAISRMAQALDLVCHQVMSRAADAQTVFYELGQLLRLMNTWLSAVPCAGSKDSLLHVAFPSIEAFFAKFGDPSRTWPTRVYAYLE